MSIEFVITAVTFSGGARVEVPPAGVTVIVGPNNSGKTKTLHEIPLNLSSPHQRQRCHVVKDVSFHRSGSTSALQEWLEANTFRDDRSHRLSYRRLGTSGFWQDLEADWSKVDSGYLGRLTTFLLASIDVGQGTGFIRRTSRFDEEEEYPRDYPRTPMHQLYTDSDLEGELSRISEEYFGHKLTLQRLGNELSLRIGVPEAEVPLVNRPTREYAEAEAALPVLDEQGHGMRGFLGLALRMLVVDVPVILVDEPEVYLHPPHRRALGRLMSKLSARHQSQLLVSTHDADLLWGLIDGDSEVAVIRLTRSGDTNHATPISTDKIRKLWSDPLLRYSRVFDGLFYDRVVVVESDADCRFYGAITDYLVESGAIRRPDVLFIPSGGKDRLHVPLEALRSVGVDCVVAADFDVLRGGDQLRRLVEVAGGDWAEVDDLRRKCDDAIRQRKLKKSVLGLREALDGILPSEASYLDRDSSDKIRRLFAYEDGWTEAKKTGLKSVPSGEAYIACATLLKKLAEVGVYVSPHGELESFVRDAGGHGPSWVRHVLENRQYETAKEAHEFTSLIVAAEPKTHDPQ